MKVNSMDIAKFCHYLLYFLSFFGLLVPCYVYFMNDAINESKNRATTVTKRLKALEIELPSLILCPKPSFKQSVFNQYNLSIPVRDIFTNPSWLFDENLGMKQLLEKNVKELYDELYYTNDITFLFNGLDLRLGENNITVIGDFDKANLGVEIQLVPTTQSGNCYLMEFNLYSKWQYKGSAVYIRFNQNLDLQDIPKDFVVYFTHKNGWHEIVTEEWVGHKLPLKIDTSNHNFPLQIDVSQLTREYYYPLGSEHNETNQSRDFDIGQNFSSSEQNLCIVSVYILHFLTTCLLIVFLSII